MGWCYPLTVCLSTYLILVNVNNDRNSELYFSNFYQEFYCLFDLQEIHVFQYSLFAPLLVELLGDPYTKGISRLRIPSYRVPVRDS